MQGVLYFGTNIGYVFPKPPNIRMPAALGLSTTERQCADKRARRVKKYQGY